MLNEYIEIKRVHILLMNYKRHLKRLNSIENSYLIPSQPID